MADVEIRPFVPEKASRELWDAYHAFRRIRRDEFDPTEPLTPDDVAEARMRHLDPDEDEHHVVALSDGRVVGYAGYAGAAEGSRGYATNRPFVWVWGGVITPYRRRGIGRALMMPAIAYGEGRGARTLDLWSSEPDGFPFIERLGAELKAVERESRLYFDRIDWDQVERWIAELAERAPGTELVLLDNRLPDDLEGYAAAREEMLNLMPFDDLDHGDITVTAENLRVTMERHKIDGSEHHTVYTVEPDGAISSITDVVWSPSAPNKVSQWFTGVHPSYRGRGLGKAIKAAMLRFVRDRYQGIDWVSTENSQTNAAMLAINEALGFREHRLMRAYQVPIERARETLVP